MDPTKSNGEWSASEIEMVKSLIARYNTSNNCNDNMNKKHIDIVNEVHAMLPMKDKLQVIRLYVDLIMEMMPSGTSNDSYYHGVSGRANPVNINMEIPVEDPAVYTTRVAQEAPHRQPPPRMERRTGFWTTAEHRLLILLDVIQYSYINIMWSFIYLCIFLNVWYILHVNYYYTSSNMVWDTFPKFDAQKRVNLISLVGTLDERLGKSGLEFRKWVLVGDLNSRESKQHRDFKAWGL